jgi:hypothetical protein
VRLVDKFIRTKGTLIIIIIIINRSVIVRQRVIAMDTGCACARPRVNRCMTRSHTKVIIVLRVRGEWRPSSIARTNKRPAEEAAVAAEPLRASPALELYSYVMILLWSPPLTTSCIPSSVREGIPHTRGGGFLFYLFIFPIVPCSRVAATKY